MSNFSAIAWRDDVRFVLNLHALLDIL